MDGVFRAILIKKDQNIMEEKDKGGRPKKQIDKKIFENLCKIQCTKDDVCGIFDCDEKTITRWCQDTYEEGFSDVYKRKSSIGKMSLRRNQYAMSETNPTMAIWLGKNWLGQSDKTEIDHKSSDKSMTPKDNSFAVLEAIKNKYHDPE